MTTPSDPSPKRARRDLFIGLGGLIAVAAGWQMFGVREGPLRFVPLPGVEGWQLAETAAITAPVGGAAGAVLAGIGETRVQPLAVSALCDVLYQSDGQGVPVAVFSDFFCPNCRTLDARLARRTDLAITWHQLPLLGPASEVMAKALMAADAQGGYVAMRDALLARPFRPGPRMILDAAGAAGLDAARVQAETDDARTAERLAQTAAAGETLAVWGTPAFTIGRTLVMGSVSEAQIDQLVAAHREVTC